MEQYAGIDVSLEASHVCVVDAQGKILKEAKVASEPEALIAWFAAHGTPMARIGLEAGPLSQWLFAGMKAAGLAVELLETRHVRAAFKTMPVKTDRKDARGIAQLMRLGWFRPVHCKSLPAQEVRGLQLHALAYNLANFFRTLVLPDAVERWSLTTLREKVVKIGAKVITHARYTVFQMAEVAVSRDLFRRILQMIDGLRPRPVARC